MILIQQISNLDLEYIDDIKECLRHNVLNPIIDTIVIFSNCKNFESSVKIDSRKIKYFEVEIDLFEMMKYGKKNSKDFIIYSTPFLKFGIDLKKVMTLDAKNVLKEENCYYIFDKRLDIKNKRNIEDILDGQKLPNILNLQKIGYYTKGFQYNYYDWKVSRTYKEKKVEEKVELISEKVELPKITNKVEQKIIDIIPSKRVGIKKLDVIIVSVNYNDFLIVSLENNIDIFENITVVTSSSDFLCQKICEKFGVNCVVTDVMYENNAVFNKGKAINEGIRSIPDPDYILLLDADILVMEQINLDLLEEDVLYTSDRYMVTDYQKYLYGDIKKDIFLQKNQGLGFFQLFNFSMCSEHPQSSTDASSDDLKLRDKFELRKNIKNFIIHLGTDSNWKGRKSKSFLEYKQFNFLLEKKHNLPIKTFKICTFYYNPKKDLRLKENFLKFLTQFELYQDKILIGMVDYDDELDIPDYFKENVIVVKGDIKNPIWYKEILLNRMVDVIDTDYVIWMDNDLIYENLDWLKNINSVVRGNDFVQLFETINYLDENGSVLGSNKSIISSGSNDIDRLLGEGYRPGGSWIGKTSILKDKKFFEKMYVGGGDTIFLYGLFGIDNGHTLKLVKNSNEFIWREAVDWINTLERYRLGYLDVSINHLYHGDLKDRDYDNRYNKLCKFKPNDKRLVSVIIVNYNCESLLERAIDSIINQTHKNIELIVLDNASTDDSSLIFEKYRNIKNINIFLNTKNLGPYWAKNSIIDKINGDYVTMLDSDDMDIPEKIEKQLSCFDDKTMMVSCSYQRENESPSFGYPSMMWRKEVFEKIGYYDSTRFGADSEFFDRFIKVYGSESHFHIGDVLQMGPRRMEGLTMLFPEKSKIRKQYISNYQKWHNTKKDLYIDFPLVKRGFNIPKEMVINEDIPYFEIKKIENENDILPVIMCVWKRVDGFKKVVDQLNLQTFKKFKLFIWNNNVEMKNEFEDVLKFAKFKYEIFHSVDNIGGFGRFYYAGQIRRKPGFMDYCVFIDDDQTFGNELLDVFYNEREYNTIKSQWGWKFSGLNYYSDRIPVSVGEDIHYAGTGGMIADMKVFEDEELFLCRKEYWYVEDLWLSYFANKKHGYRLVKSGVLMKNGDDEHSLYKIVKEVKTPMLNYLINDERWDILKKYENV